MTTAQVATDVPISTYPRKGTETLSRHCIYTKDFNISTYPRKGTETRKSTILIREQLISTYPRKGTETPSSEAWMHNFCKFQLIPARGRKLLSALMIILLGLHFNLSPQGDGNELTAIPVLLTSYNFNLSPQGDGNVNTLMSVLLFGISTYPRKGTETQSHLLHYRSQEYFNLSPQTLSGAARQLSRRESFSSCRYPVLSSPFRGSWHGVSRD